MVVKCVGAVRVAGQGEPYGMREAVHLDPDNNLIRFGSPLKKN